MRPMLSALLVCVLAAPALAQQASVAGTDGTNALGYVPCARGGQPMGKCAAELLRKDGGKATLRVLLPGAEVRYVYFENGKAVSTNATGAMVVADQGATLLISIDPDEVIELPKRAVQQ